MKTFLKTLVNHLIAFVMVGAFFLGLTLVTATVTRTYLPLVGPTDVITSSGWNEIINDLNKYNEANGLMRYHDNGSIGLGVVNPGAQIDVLTPAGRDGLKIKGSTADSSRYAAYYLNSSSAPLLHVRNDGNVGIGIAAPSSKLEVAGTVKATAFTGNGSNISGVVKTETDPTVLASVKDGVSWGEVSGKPGGFADGVDNMLNETQVDSYANNNGYLKTETDPTVLASVKDGVSWGEVSGKPGGFADGVDNVLSQATVDSYANNNGYLKTETDPQVGSMTNGGWCVSDGSTISCTSAPPSGDPKTFPGTIAPTNTAKTYTDCNAIGGDIQKINGLYYCVVEGYCPGTWTRVWDTYNVPSNQDPSQAYSGSCPKFDLNTIPLCNGGWNTDPIKSQCQVYGYGIHVYNKHKCGRHSITAAKVKSACK